MITHLGLTHFKSMDSLAPQQVHGLTLLCGTNSSGKSSFLQSLLLLRQSLDQPGRSALSMNGPLVRLGHYSDIVSAKRKNSVIEYRLTLVEDTQLTLVYGLEGEDDVRLRSLTAVIGGLTVSISADGRARNRAPFRPKVTAVDGSSVQFEYTAITTTHTLGNLQSPPKGVEVTSRGAREAPEAHAEDASAGDPLVREQEARDTLVALQSLLDKLAEWLQDHLQYVGPIRQAPERYYVVEGRAELGPQGENTVAVLMQHWNEKIIYLAPQGTNRTTSTLGKAVERWLEHFLFRNTVKATAEKSMLYQLQLRLPRVEGDKTVSPRDVGYGLSQILPIVVAGLRAKPGDMLVLEQPEIHLHPAVQARLGDFLLSLSATGKAVLVETHSDHLVNRLRLRVAQDDTDEFRNSVRVLFTEQEQGEWRSSVRSLHFDKFGSLDDWPKGFFDEADQELRDLAEAGMKKLWPDRQ